MAHPPLEELLRGEPPVSDHLAGCATCRALVALAEVPADATEPRDDRFPVDRVDRDRYLEWRVLGGGGGGMGRTFQARDRRLGRDVVIKQPLTADHGFDLRTRFEREALLTARLQHPSIVGVYEAGRFDDGEPFFAMPLVHGAPLSDEIARRSTLEDRLALLGNVTAVCEAVAYAHEQGIVHRDIKPANILIGSFGETVLIDWGLATDVRDATPAGRETASAEVGDGLTQLGVGTAQYMPPEQAHGGPPDPRMDVYALGATLYHALAGVPPYGSVESSEARHQLLAEPPRSLSQVAPDVPPALCDIITRAMAREPAQRFDTASALAAELRRFQTGQLVQSRRYGPGEILRHFARKHRAPLIVAAVAAVVLAVAAIASAVRIARAGRAAAAAQQRAEDNERLSQQELRRGLGVSASRLAPVPTRRLDALALAVDAVAPDLAAGRTPVHEAVQGLYDAIAAGAPAVVLDANTTVVRRFAFSSDGALLATVSPGEHAVHVWDGRTGELRGTAAAGGAHFSVRDLRFSPDGRWLLTWGDEPAQAQLWPVEQGRPITLSLDGAIAGAEFLPDGEIVVAGNALTQYRADGVLVRSRELAAPATTLTVGGGSIAVGTTAGDVIVADASGQTLASLRVASVAKLALSQDGRRLAILGSSFVEIHTLAAPTVVQRVALGVVPSERTTLGFADSGRSVVVSDPVQATSVVIDVPADGAPAPRATALSSTWFATSEPWTGRPGHLERFDLDPLAMVQSVDGPPGLALEALAVAPGRRVAAATERATWLVDARVSETGSLPHHASEVTALAVADTTIVSASLDGRLFAWDAQYRRTATAAVGSEVLVMAALGRAVVVGAADGSLGAFPIAAGQLGPRIELVPAGAPVSALAASPDSRFVVAARGNGEVLALDAARASAPVVWQSPGAPTAMTVVFSADGAWAATGHLDGTLRLWRLSPGASTASLVATTVIADRDNAGRARYMLAFDASGRLLASRFGVDTAVFATPALEKRGALAGRLLAVTRDGTHAATLRDGELVLFDLARPGDGTRIATAKRPLVSATFSPDGSELLVGDVDGTIRRIEVTRDHSADTDAVVEIPATRAGAVTALAFSPDGHTVIAGHASGALRSHPLGLQAAVDRACRTLADFGRTVASCPTAK